jgi:diguanylate cyclase (GGDEF)-like protein
MLASYRFTSVIETLRKRFLFCILSQLFGVEMINMNAPYTNDTQIMNRKILNVYWFIILITTLSSVAAFSIDLLKGSERAIMVEHTMNYWVKPTLCMLLICAIGEWVIYRKLWLANYTGLIISGALPIIFILFYYEVKGIHFTLLYTIMISALYYKRKKLIVTTLFVMLAFLVMIFIYEPMRIRMDTLSSVFGIAAFLCFAMLANAVMQQGLALRRDLERSVADHQRLFVENIAKDRIAKIDGLTNAYNRKAFDELMEELGKRNYIFSLAIFDVDDFKKINDTYGHMTGDKVLQELAECAAGILPADDYFFRYGGEEFIVLYFEKDFTEVRTLAEKLRAGVEMMKLPELDGRSITVSIGLAQRKDNQSIDDLKQEADRLLYQAKRAGKNQMHFAECQLT